MIALPTTDATDLAAKMIVHTKNFDFASSEEHAPEFQRQVRAFFEGVEANVEPTTPVTAQETPYARVKHHVDEIMRVLEETAPDGFHFAKDLFVAEGTIVAGAYPENWNWGQERATLDAHTGGWRIKS